jgi:hypothetical protein
MSHKPVMAFLGVYESHRSDPGTQSFRNDAYLYVPLSPAREWDLSFLIKKQASLNGQSIQASAKRFDAPVYC